MFDNTPWLSFIFDATEEIDLQQKLTNVLSYLFKKGPVKRRHSRIKLCRTHTQ